MYSLSGCSVSCMRSTATAYSSMQLQVQVQLYATEPLLARYAHTLARRQIAAKPAIRPCFPRQHTLLRQQSSTSTRFPAGFEAAGVSCGIKKKQGVLDFAIFKSAAPCSAAAVFTTNKFCAAPVVVSREVLDTADENVHGVVINSGCANACTGDKGLEDARDTIKYAESKGIKHSLVMSTGVIGPHLPMDKIRLGIDKATEALGSSHEHWQNASKAIMTTDTVNKLVSQTFNLPDGSSYTLAGTAKGAGMIHPNMATMLSVVCTDAAIAVPALQQAVKYAADRSFNNISVDGDTSTNDTFAVLANGQSDMKQIKDTKSQEFQHFQKALTKVSANLAKQLVADGEGATKFVAITVDGAKTFQQARTIGASISTSALVKTALFGQDANWGRILCATGYAGEDINPDTTNLYFIHESETSEENDEGVREVDVNAIKSKSTKSLHLVKDGRPYHIDEDIALDLLKQKNIYIYIHLGLGQGKTTYWTIDYSYDYVKINADYRS